MLLQKAKLYQQKFIRFNILKVTFKPSVVNGMVNCLSIEISMVTNVTQCVEESDNFVGQGKVWSYLSYLPKLRSPKGHDYYCTYSNKKVYFLTDTYLIVSKK